MKEEKFMEKLDEFYCWMQKNLSCSERSLKHYKGAVKTVSEEMLANKIINKSLLAMSPLEIDAAIPNILANRNFIEKNTRGKRMYSNGLKKFRYFVMETEDIEEEELKIATDINEDLSIDATERQAIIKSRIGQGFYRNNLFEKYNKKCIVTGIDNNKLLIASHIKPWRVCNNTERIDTENGLLLCVNMDRLFDCGLITFKNNGQMLISSFVGKENEKRLGISKETFVDLKAGQALNLYMEYHRDVLFIK